MKRTLILTALLLGLATGAAAAQTRVGVSLSFSDPYVHGHVQIGRPYYHRYSRPYYRSYYRPYYRRYHRAPVIVVAPRVVVVRPHRYHPRRHGRRR